MKLYVKVTTISTLLLLLNGCQLISKPSTSSSQPDTVQTVVVEQPPKMVKTDWKSIISPLIERFLQSAKVESNNRLLISDVKNGSNSYISSAQINNLIFNSLNQQDIFVIIDKQTINQAKQKLGIAYDDALISRSKMIALARNVQADYVLFTTINQPPKLPDTEADVVLELLLVNTGEIVWQLSSNQLIDNLTAN